MNYLNFPIGLACPYASFLLLSADDKVIESTDVEGELVVAGTSVFNQYWKDEDKTSAAFYSDAKHQRYYRTGDIVYRNKEGAYVYVARKDRMIKKNGYRIEPSEIEKIVVSYPKVSNAVVLFSKEKNILICFVESVEVIDNDIFNIRVFCQNHLPLYMLPDKFVVLFSMPQTSSGKVDLQALKNMI
jgi:acyl-coenzyme A synthetase/AMP-(fatty) acid ligase